MCILIIHTFQIMESPETVSSSNSHGASDSDSRQYEDTSVLENEDVKEIQEQVLANLEKPNLPNVNVPEKIIVCLDVCYDNPNSLYRFGDGTTFSPINMLKRILDFFFHTKHAISKKTEFALITLQDAGACWTQNFTSNVKDLISAIDYAHAEEATSDTFDFEKVYELIRHHIEIPMMKPGESLLPPPYIVRLLILYGRSNCVPVIPHEDPCFQYIRSQIYFYTDILLAHEDDCATHKCDEIYDALQDLDNGYSYVFEVSRNATKIHDCIAKLLAHPLQRPLQKNTDYSFGSRY
uniref:BRISC and BRCA1-A complex member 1 n=1 Tax=Bombyx mori TaxID=7091 RepID=A0A8R2DMK8_BOMMO|nr:BRISC and BRCA1-A complex member 1 isoform X1 [Bombyx mori]